MLKTLNAGAGDTADGGLRRYFRSGEVGRIVVHGKVKRVSWC